MRNAKQLAQDTQSEPVLSDFCKSLELVGGNVFYLFVGKAVSSVLRKVSRIETRSDSLKRKIIYVAKGLDCDALLNFIATMSAEDIRSVGMDFLCITAKKISKNYSVENFTRFLELIFTKTGFENGLVKIFLFGDRNIQDLSAFLDHIKVWADVETFSKCVLSTLDKLGSCGQIEFMTQLIAKYGAFVKVESDNSKMIQRVAGHFFQSALHNGNSTETIISMLKKLVNLGYRINHNAFNKMLDMINKSSRRDDLMEALVSYMEEIKVDFNLVTYNCILDYYCSNELFEMARNLYESFESKGFKGDNYTFSILLKGIKNSKNPDLEFADKIIELYLQNGNIVDLIILNSAIDVYMTHGDSDRACNVITLIKERTSFAPDHVTFSTLIKGCCKNKDFEVAMKFFAQMKTMDVKPSRIIYNSLMDLAVKDQKLKMALSLIEEMQKDEVSPDGYTYSIILNGLKINESSELLVKLTLDNLKKVLEGNPFRLDEALFNTILDACLKYELFDYLDYFYTLMRAKGINESPITFAILLKAYSKQQKIEKALLIFEQMLKNKVAVHDITYGSLLDACSKINRMDFALKIFEYLETMNFNMNSIVFTTILKGFIKNEELDNAIAFFNRVKKYTHLNGMIITYNCALDIYVRKGDVDNCMKLFEELNSHFVPDIISYSTIIKGLCTANRRNEAFTYVKKMMEVDPTVDVSVVNLFLDSCANTTDFKLGIEAYQYVMMKNISPNEITFGIMIKIYGFSKELHKAFDLLDLMAAFDITPSIIIYTNLIHISFYNRNPKKADVAYTLAKRAGIKGDRLMYSKLIDGFMRFKEHDKVIKYVELALKENCALKSTTMDELYGYFHDDSLMMEKIKQFKNITYVEHNTHKEDKIKRLEAKKAEMRAKNRVSVEKNRNIIKNVNNNNEQTKDDKPKRMIRIADTKIDNNNTKSFKKTEVPNKTGGFNADNTKKPLALFNFRTKN